MDVSFLPHLYLPSIATMRPLTASWTVNELSAKVRMCLESSALRTGDKHPGHYPPPLCSTAYYYLMLEAVVCRKTFEWGGVAAKIY